MTKLKLLWCVLIPLSFVACTSLATRPAPEPQWFQQVCDLVEEEYAGACDDLSAPDVVVGSAPMLLDAYGFYIPGEQYVYVLSDYILEEFQRQNPLFDVPDMYEVRLHETVHYVADWAGLELGRCASEALARELTARWKGTTDDGQWRVRYGCGGSMV